MTAKVSEGKKIRPYVLASILFFTLQIVFPLSTEAATITVNSAVDGVPDGGCSLREAIRNANADFAVSVDCFPGFGSDDIVFASSLDGIPLVLSAPPGGGGENSGAAGDLDITDDLAINGRGAGNTIVSGGNFTQVFHILPGANVEITDLTIRNGFSANGFGGPGIRNEGNAVIANSEIVDNDSDGLSGGGVVNTNVMMILNSTISGNTTGGAGSGGGIRHFGGSLLIINSTISENETSGFGGGINVDGDGMNAMLNNVTIMDNTCDTDSCGGGINGNATISNTIIAGNNDPSDEAPDCDDTITSEGSNLIGDGTGCNFVDSTGDQVGTGASPIDPMLDELDDNGGPTRTHALLEDSPAIDTGNDATCEDTDQRGAERPQDGNDDGDSDCDIGAFELILESASSTTSCSLASAGSSTASLLLYLLLPIFVGMRRAWNYLKRRK